MNRQALKYNAKSVLYAGYWKAFFACLITTLLSGATSAQYGSSSAAYDRYTAAMDNSEFFIRDNWVERLLANPLAIFAIIGLIIVFNIFFVSPLLVGKASFFLSARNGEFSAKPFLEIFRGDGYTNAVKAMFMKNLIVALWSLLIIPGIYFSFAYRYVPYLIAENPEMTWREALDESKRMTNGYKVELFILDLSFFGWYFLASLIFIGSYFVDPYYEATNAEAYISLKQ